MSFCVWGTVVKKNVLEYVDCGTTVYNNVVLNFSVKSPPKDYYFLFIYFFGHLSLPEFVVRGDKNAKHPCV